MALSFKQVVAILKDVNGIHADRQSAFESRLKQWQKMGFPDGVNVGKGTRASYGAKQVYQLAICLALLEIGMTPERAHEVVRLGWKEFALGIVEATECIANQEGHDHYWFIKYDALTDLKEASPSHNHVSVISARGDHISFALADDDPEIEWSEDELMAIQQTRWWFLNDMARCVILEVDSLLARIWFAMAEIDVEPATFRDEIRIWRETAHADMAKRRDDASLQKRNAVKQVALNSLQGLADKYPPDEIARSMLDQDFGRNLHVHDPEA